MKRFFGLLLLVSILAPLVGWVLLWLCRSSVTSQAPMQESIVSRPSGSSQKNVRNSWRSQ